MSKKQQRIKVIIFAALGVYCGFRYVLPILLPFLISGLLARLCEPLSRKLYQKWKCPLLLSTGIQLLLLTGGGAACIVLAGKKALEQLGQLIQGLGQYEEVARKITERFSGALAQWTGMEPQALYEWLWRAITGGIEQLREGVTSWIFDNGSNICNGFVRYTTVFVLIQVAVLLWSKEWPDVRRWERNSLFAKEIAMIKAPLMQVGKAYLKTQLVIVLLVMGELMLGLSLMGNSYSIVLGIVIGILDALPLFGTGTVLIPWTLIALLMGDLKKAAMVAALYLICYFTRQLLEPRLMGSGTGLTPLESLIAIYMGLKLFGLWGLFLGPIAWLLVKECAAVYS